jgi:hypothetical protein
MWIVIVLLLILPVAILVILRMTRRARRETPPWDGKGVPSHEQATAAARNMPTPEAMYAMSFPDLAPLFNPAGLLEWYAWYLARGKSRQLIRDGRRWHGEVPGFAGAAIMSVKGEGDTDVVVLQNDTGQTLIEMTVENQLEGDARISTGAGVFYVTPESSCRVRFEGENRGFDWRGPGNWSFRSALAPQAMHAQNGGLTMGGTAGVAGGAAVGALAGAAVQRSIDGKASQQDQRRAGSYTSY